MAVLQGKPVPDVQQVTLCNALTRTHVQALGASIITIVAIVLCVRILRGRKRWRGLSSSGLSRRMGSLSSFAGLTSGLGIPPQHFISISCMVCPARGCHAQTV